MNEERERSREAGLDQPFSFAWAPPESDSYLGGILLKGQPTRHFDSLNYQTALADRIGRLINEEEPGVARELLRRVEREDTGVLFSSIRAAPAAIVEWSQWLHDRVHFPLGGLPADKLQHDPELMVLLQEDDSLEAYLNRLYDRMMY